MSVPKDTTHFAFCILRFALCIFAVASASPRARAEKQSQTVDGRQYLPLEAGREMRYQVTVTPPLGKPRQATATNKTEQAVLNGKTYFKTTTTITGVPFIPDQAIFYRSTADGIYQVLEGDEESPEWLYLPAKIKIGDRWGAETPSGNFTFSAVAFEDVETPSGKYPNCLKLRVIMKKTLVTNTQEQWLARGVGSVKQSDSNAVFSSATVLEQVTTDKSE